MLYVNTYWLYLENKKCRGVSLQRQSYLVGEVASSALVGHPSNDGVSVRVP